MQTGQRGAKEQRSPGARTILVRLPFINDGNPSCRRLPAIGTFVLQIRKAAFGAKRRRRLLRAFQPGKPISNLDIEIYIYISILFNIDSILNLLLLF